MIKEAFFAKASPAQPLARARVVEARRRGVAPLLSRVVRDGELARVLR